MMRTGYLTLWILCCVASAPAFGQPARAEADWSKVPRLQPHYQPEFTFDTNTDVASWLKQQPGLHVAFGSTDKLYPRCEVPDLTEHTRVWEATGWQGQRLNSQVLVWSTDPQEQVRFEITTLRSKTGRQISSGRFGVNLVRYVLSNLPYGAKGFSCDVTNGVAYLMPDRLERFERFDLPERTVRPVWISIDIPRTAAPGEYTGAIRIRSLKGQVPLELKIRVQDLRLPEPHHWKFRLDLWQNPWVVASYFQVEPWSQEHKALLKKHLQHFAQAGGKYITTYTVHSPWSDNSYVLEGTMIEWIKTTAGWKFDYSIFDQYVQLAMEAGVDEAITIYTPIPWGHRFRYLDEASGNFVYVEWSPKSAEFKAFWNTFLDDLKRHLKKKGWFEKTYLGINENPLDLTLAAARVIKEHSKEWKITYAGDWHPELSPLLDDYSTIITREPGAEDIRQRTHKDFTTTFYVCCNPPQPNNFVFSAPVEGRYIGWYAAAFGYSGFLRWAYDAWPADPMRDARHTLWPAGDCFLVYPGGNSSIRFEKLREGIVDYEKIRILRAMASRSSRARVKTLTQELEKHLAGFAAERDHAKRNFEVPAMIEAVQRGQDLINTLSVELGKSRE